MPLQREEFGFARLMMRELFAMESLACQFEVSEQGCDSFCSRAFVIRGEPIPGRDLSDIRRTKSLKDGEPAGFREIPRRWLCVDADQALPGSIWC